ncbi:MAG: helix-turn-helix transcriptional regulator, partial [Lachnospiraceae bacterium]|nr:helix-turn-helix transcriptional regulator [Lachnospiraceae bacterium]
MTLGEKIYKLRTERGLSQETFGDKLGVSRQSVSKWETDQSLPELEKIIALSEFFGVSTDYLLKDTLEENG